jgi:hypothetical protein
VQEDISKRLEQQNSAVMVGKKPGRFRGCLQRLAQRKQAKLNFTQRRKGRKGNVFFAFSASLREIICSILLREDF